MVRFASITIEFEDGTSHTVNSLSAFNDYRLTSWNELAPADRLAYIREWNSHSIAERGWEIRYRLPPHSLAGTCLIFGNRLRAQEKLREPEVRATLVNERTEVAVEIEEKTGNVSVLIRSGEITWADYKCFIFSYGASELLLPQFEAMSSDTD
jgi:hypothetical protein